MTEKTAKDSHYARLRRNFRDNKQKYGDNKKNVERYYMHRHGDTLNSSNFVQLYGIHTVRAALLNPRRTLHRLLTTQNAWKKLTLPEQNFKINPEFVTPRQLDNILGIDTVHQGIMLETKPLPSRSLQHLKDYNLIVVLDQITDPHNVGSIMRSAVAFNAQAIITTARHSVKESGVLAKVASGALELIDYVGVRNLSDALNEIHEMGFMTYGLDSQGQGELACDLDGDKIAIVLGAEGKGLRQKTRQTVNYLSRLDVPGVIKSLNVSNACAISLYAAYHHIKRK